MKNNYFQMILEQAEFCKQAAEAFNIYISDFDPEKLRDQTKQMHEIEHTADMATHEISIKLDKEFIAPIDREDILSLTQCIDDVIDTIEDVFTKLYIYNVTSLRKEIIEYGQLILDGTSKLCEICEEFENFKKSNQLDKLAVELNTIEEDGDRIYFLGIRRLFTQSNVTLEEQLKWKSIIEALDNCLDCCEKASDMMQRIILKNT